MENILKYKAIYYVTSRGESPVEKFVDGLDELTQARFHSYVNLLREHGPNLKRPYADVVRGKIRELRPRQARALYFFAVGDTIVFVHGLLKKRDALDPRDIDLAELRMWDWLKRHGEKNNEKTHKGRTVG